MPRLSATPGGAPPAVSGKLPRARLKKKPSPQQDRLTARTLFMRRVRRSMKPGFWVLGGLCIVVLGSEALRAMPAVGPVVSPAGSIRHGLAGVAAAAGFKIADIQILGADTTAPAVIKAALGVGVGDPSFGFSLAAAAARIEQVGPVQTATVHRAWPGTIIVTVTERAPYAIWQTEDSQGAAIFLLIDKQGNVIANQDAGAAKRREPGLLLLVGQGAPQNAGALMTALHAQPAVFARVAAAEWIDGLRWNLTLKDQTVVKLPAQGEQDALAQLGVLQSSMALLDRPVEWIDMRLPGKLVIHPYPAPTGHT